MPHLYQDIAETIRRRIATGDLKPGDRLQPVRGLAEQWNCTPGTVNRAYRELAEEGLVSGHRGSGTRVLQNRLINTQPELEWANLVNRAEQFLLETLRGGHDIDQAQTALSVAVSRWHALQRHQPAERDQQPSSKHLRFAGSHDLSVEIVTKQLLTAQDGGRLELTFVGSLGGLMALARGEADVAGVHLWDASTNSYNLPFVRRILPQRRLALVTLIHRQLGFIVPRGNPQRIEQLGDLSIPGIRWMNRQPGSGTRIWLDEQLQRVNIDPDQIQGYERESATHMGVAQAVQSGQATAGLGIRAAALAYGLTFVHLTDEIYQLVVPEEVWDRRIWQTLLHIIRSDWFSDSVNHLGGYDTKATGEVAWV